MVGRNIFIQAFMNIHGQTGLPTSKQKQIENFLSRYNVDILHCQEININEETFSQCNFINSNYSIISNNAVNRYGTATLIRNGLIPENIRKDINGRAIFFNVEGITLGNVYLPSGTDGPSKADRENYFSETIPQLLVNRKSSGCWGGDFNCVTKKVDCTHNPESKLSSTLTRLLSAFSHFDSFRVLSPQDKVYSHFYKRLGGDIGASRLDRSYHWGNIEIVETAYISVAFSDHCAFLVKMTTPNIDMCLPP